MATLNQSQDLEHHKKKIEDRQRERPNTNNSSTESETTSRPRSLNWGSHHSSHHDLRSVKLVMESNMAPLESELKIGGEEEEDDGNEKAETSAPSRARVLTNVFVPTRTQLFTIPPEGERANLTRRRFVIDETRKPTTALCEFVDDIRETAMADDEQNNGRVPRAAAGAEGPEPIGDPKANSARPEQPRRRRRRSSAVPSSSSATAAGAPTTLQFSPSSSSLGPPENPSFKSTSPFSPMQTHSRSQLSLQLCSAAAVANHRPPRPSEPETVDSPTLVVIDPSVEAILNERRPRSPSAPDTPTNSVRHVKTVTRIS